MATRMLHHAWRRRGRRETVSVVSGSALIAFCLLASMRNVASAECMTPNYGYGSTVFAPEDCGTLFRTDVPGGGDGSGTGASSINFYPYKNHQVVGTDVVITFDKYDVRTIARPIVMRQVRTKDWHENYVSVFPKEVSSPVPCPSGTCSQTLMGFQYYIHGSYSFRQISATINVVDKGSMSLRMYLRVLAHSACQLQNLYYTLGCTPENVRIDQYNPGVGWEFGFDVVDHGNPPPTPNPTYPAGDPRRIDPKCWSNLTPAVSVVPIGSYSPLINSSVGLTESNYSETACDDLIHFQATNTYYYWSCSNCLEHCLPPPNLPLCPRGCGAVKSQIGASDEMWCQSHNNSPPWQNSFASDSGLVDVYDAVTGGDPSGPTFDICSGDVPGTPCEGRAELLLGLMARPMGVKPDLLEVGNLQIKMYPDYGYAGPCMPPGFSKWPHVNVQIIKRDDRGGFPGRNILRNYHFTVIIDEGDKCLCVWESKTGFTFKNCNHPSGWGLAMKSVIYDGLEEIWESGNTMVKLTIAAVIAGAVFDWIVVPDPIPGPVPLVQAERPFSAAVRLAVPVYSTWAREDMNGG